MEEITKNIATFEKLIFDTQLKSLQEGAKIQKNPGDKIVEEQSLKNIKTYEEYIKNYRKTLDDLKNKKLELEKGMLVGPSTSNPNNSVKISRGRVGVRGR